MKRRARKITALQASESESSWAVSYSDLLMVLMSFFIIFFNLEEIEVPQQMESLILSLEESFSSNDLSQKRESLKKRSLFVSSKKPADRDRKYRDGKVGKTVFPIPADLELGRLKMETLGAQGVIIDLPDAIYTKGEFKVNETIASYIDRIKKAIGPHRSDVQVIFLGHTDSTPLRKSRQIIQSNVTLGSLRAAHAAEYFNGDNANPWVSAQGIGRHQRNTRSLSVKILWRGRS